MKTICRIAAAAFIALAASPAAAQFAPRLDAIDYFTADNADGYLKPGDVMLKRLNQSSPLTTVGIKYSQDAIQVFSGIWGSDAAAEGDTSAVHVAIYLGGGQTAEAHGNTDVDREGVSLRSLSQHAGFIWWVYRPKDAALGAEAAAVARTWATGRMGYLAPFSVPLHDSDFGPKGRSEALEYGRAAQVAGGPAGIDKMFCSQFVLAAYQAAHVARLLKANARLGADQVTMYPGMDRQASYTSPMAMHGHLRTLRQDLDVGFSQMRFAVAQLPPRLDATPQLPQGGGAAFFKAAAGPRQCFSAVPNPMPGMKPAKGSPVLLAACNGDPLERWRAKDGLMVNEASGLCLGIDSGRLQGGQKLIVWDCHGGPDQKWAFKDGQLQLGGTGLCADAGAGYRGGTVALGTCARTPGNTWERGV